MRRERGRDFRNLRAQRRQGVRREIDVGIGLPSVSDKFTPNVKYVSGEKDGFKVDRAVILGVILDFAKTFGR